MINPYIFREYDIRGVVDKDLDNENVYLLGKADGTFFQNYTCQRVSVGGDVRLSTERLRSILINGLRDSGVDVVDIGAVPTPVQYFSMHYLDVDAGVMLTGSHNPPEFNGFKLTMHNKPVFGEDIQEIRRIIEEERFLEGQGALETTSVTEAYMDEIAGKVQINNPLKVVLDSGNGAASLVAHKLFRMLGVKTIDLFDEPDGNFPNHHPDPTVPDNIKTLIETVIKEKADFGVGYDGDGDRIGVVDEKGEIVWGDRLMIVFSREILKERPGAPILFEVKCSQALVEMIERFGGEPVMWKTGHSNLKMKMKEKNAPLAGEMSGHLFFADRYYGYDDAIYASARLAELLAAKPGTKMSQLLDDVPTYYSTPEIRVDVKDDKEKFAIAQKARDYFSENYDVIDVDGVRIQFEDGWGLVRASNTQPVLVLRFEATTERRLEEIKKLVIEQLRRFGEISL